MGAYSNKLTLSSLRIMKKSKKRNIWLEINVQPKVVSFFFLFLFKGMFKPVLAGLKITLETWNNHCFQWWFCCTKRESHLLFCSKDIYRIFYQFLSCTIKIPWWRRHRLCFWNELMLKVYLNPDLGIYLLLPRGDNH